MQKFSADLSKVSQVVSGNKVYRYDDVKHQLKKVAFDVVRFSDGSDIEGLWRIQKDKDGEVIVAMYDSENFGQSQKIEKSSSWSVSTDQQNNFYIFYKNQPISKIASSSLNLSNEEVPKFRVTMEKKLASDSSLVKKLIAGLDQTNKEAVLGRFPELK